MTSEQVSINQTEGCGSITPSFWMPIYINLVSLIFVVWANKINEQNDISRQKIKMQQKQEHMRKMALLKAEERLKR
jgi:hypothetical protein